MERLRKAEEALKRLETALLVTLLSVMVALSFAQVILRQFFGTGLLWADTLARHLVLWVGFLGAALAAAEGKHFAFETSPRAAETATRAKIVVSLAVDSITIFITALLARASWTFFLDEKNAGEALFYAGGLAVPVWLLHFIIPAGFFLVLAHFSVRAVRRAAELR